MNDTPILTDLADLHKAMYARMQTISGPAGLEYLGFDDSKRKPILPNVALHMSLADIQVDRTRPTPLSAHRVEEETGSEIIRHYGGAVYTGRTGRRYRYPLPVSLIYAIDSWCHSAEQQLALDIGIMNTFPDRGAVSFVINDQTWMFPIELLGVQPLDDLAQNLRERLYRFRVDAYVESSIRDTTGGIILSSEISVYEGKTPEDINVPPGNVPMMTVLDTPDEGL